MHERSVELKTGGHFCLVTTTISTDPDIQPFQLKEEVFYQGIFDLLKTLFDRQGVSHLFQRCLYTWSLMPGDSCYFAPTTSAGLTLIETKEYLVKDCFCEHHDSDLMHHRAQKVSEFQSGYWEQTMRDSLREGGVPEEKVREICHQVFSEVIPQYCKERIEGYPEWYGGMYFVARKQHMKLL
jgi:hypothetical protein